MSQSQPTDVARYLSVFVDALYHHGVENAVICPGSRSTPLALAIKRCGAIRSYVLMDERSAAFFALGIAKASNRPTILLSTSGTAAANFLPAVVESFWGHVPLIVLTADRPPELRDSGASQTIDQVGLFGSHSKWFQDMPITDGSEQLNRFAAITAGRAVHYASNDPKGPVHLNFPFREPLIIDPLPKLPPIPRNQTHHGQHTPGRLRRNCRHCPIAVRISSWLNSGWPWALTPGSRSNRRSLTETGMADFCRSALQYPGTG